MSFMYKTMQSFTLNVLQPHIRNVIDLLESSMHDLDVRLTNFINKSIAELRQEFEEFKRYVISLFNYRPEFPIGYISSYYGNLDPTGIHPLTKDKVLTDWYVCNGQNGTPDLRDKFVIGSNNNFGKILGTKTHNHSISVSTYGSIGSTALTVTQIPTHSHSLSDRHTGIGAAGIPDKWPAGGSGVHQSVVSDVWVTGGEGVSIAVAKSYAFGDLSYHNTDSVGSGGSHTHSHSISSSASSAVVDHTPPCVSLYFIMYKK